MAEFNKGDKVIEKGTTAPIMTIEGNTVKPDFPNYRTLDDTYTCSWLSTKGKERKEFHEADLELYVFER